MRVNNQLSIRSGYEAPLSSLRTTIKSAGKRTILLLSQVHVTMLDLIDFEKPG